MTPDERNGVRKLLSKYEATLALAEDLALSLLEVVQPGAIDVSTEQARERRRFAADALATLEAGDNYARQQWTEFALDRRKAPASTALPAGVGKERRHAKRRARRTV